MNVSGRVQAKRREREKERDEATRIGCDREKYIPLKGAQIPFLTLYLLCVDTQREREKGGQGNT